MSLFAACATDEKTEVAEQTWDCMASAGDPEDFETSMLMMFSTANNLEEAKEQYIYVSSAPSLEELKAGRDEACGEQPTKQSTPASNGGQLTDAPAQPSSDAAKATTAPV